MERADLESSFCLSFCTRGHYGLEGRSRVVLQLVVKQPIEKWITRLIQSCPSRTRYARRFERLRGTRKLMRYIQRYNKAPRTVKWRYADPSRHISTESAVTGQ
jgi:hypothetical protein